MWLFCFDLTPLCCDSDYYLWSAFKDKRYANQLETIGKSMRSLAKCFLRNQLFKVRALLITLPLYTYVHTYILYEYKKIQIEQVKDLRDF